MAADLGDLSTLDMGTWPAGDGLAMESARARLEQKLFGRADPARLGRYELLGPIADGGMGSVYAAYDPELDRRVALKVVHPCRHRDEYAHERVRREARALARLDHPNVVDVHDVVGSAGETVIVMELVAGRTLASWSAESARSWREVLAAYVQAAEGLAAAHSLNIVHRDFKPTNAIIGPDGRVRVLDFGLARLVTGDAGDAPPTTASAPMPGPAHATELTHSGMVLGTLAYAAPEQLAGAEITPACDQFSFCVALHTALEGVPPFTGDAIDQRIASIRAGRPFLARDNRRIPAWLRAAVRRGLEADPAARHASMDALLAELRRPRGWTRWRWPALASALVLTTALVTHALQPWTTRKPGLACDGGAAELARVWEPGRRAAITARLAGIAAPYAREATARVVSELDERLRGWSAAHRTTCRAHRTGRVSDVLFDRAMLCLGHQLDEFRATVALLEKVGASGLAGAVKAIGELPAADACANGARLMAEPNPPGGPEHRARVARARALLSGAAAERRAGRIKEAATLVEQARRDAELSRYPPVLAEALLEHGRTLIAAGELASAAPVLRESMELALAHDLKRLAVEAAARKIYAEAAESGDVAHLRGEIPYAESISRSLSADHFARPLLLASIGAAYLAGGRPGDARPYFDLARIAVDGAKNVDLELLDVYHGLAILAVDPEERERLARRFWWRWKEALGERHPDALEARVSYAVLRADAAAARAQIDPACDGYRQSHPDLLVPYADCERVRAFLADEMGDRPAARAAYQAVIDAAKDASDEDLRLWGKLAAGELAILSGRPRHALPDLAVVIEARGQATRWWERKDALEAELATGRALAAHGHRAAATRHFEAAATGYARIVVINASIEYRLRLERAQRERNAHSPR
jgi:tetratricopeptide (TPR) repeat protein